MCPSSGKIGNGELKDWCSTKKQINGSAVHITAVFGFMLAGLVIQDIINSDTSVSVSTEAEQVPVMHEG